MINQILHPYLYHLTYFSDFHDFYLILFYHYFSVGMFGNDEFEEAKIGAVCLTMEDLARMPFDFAIDVESAEEKAWNLFTLLYEKLL